MRGSAVELFDDCPHCLLEGGLVETYDARVAACRFGVPARVACKLCGLSKIGTVAAPSVAADLTRIAGNRCPSCIEELSPEALDVRRCARCGARASLSDERPAANLGSLDVFVAHLEAWASREGFRSVSDLLSATFVEPTVGALFTLVVHRRPLETVADPFSLGGRAGGGKPQNDAPKARADAPPSRPKSHRAPPFRLVPSVEGPGAAPDLTAGTPRSSPISPLASTISSDALHAARPALATAAPDHATSGTTREVREGDRDAREPREEGAPLSAPPRAILFPLLSVVAADGEVHAAERAFVDAFLASEGMSPLRDDELKVYTPAEAARYVPKERREKIVELMCELATVDGLGDEAELRVVRAYASAWRVPEEKVETWLWGYENAQASAGRQFWLRIRRFLLSSRWERTDP